MATITTAKAQRRKEPNIPYPPPFRTLEDVRSYLCKLYTVLRDSRDTSYAGNIFVSGDAPQNFVGEDGDIYIETE